MRLEDLRFLNPTGLGIRGQDDYGDGHFGSARDGGARLHLGIDFEAPPTTAVKSLLEATVTRSGGLAYAEDVRFHTIHMRPVLTDGHNVLVKYLYVSPVTTARGWIARRGEIIGHAENIALRYQDPDGPGPKRAITPHIHVEVWVDGVRIDFEHLLEAV